MSENQIILIGNVGAEIKIGAFPSGKRYARFSVATENWKSREDGKPDTDWHNVSVYHQKTVEYIERHLQKGDKVYIKGAMRYPRFPDKDNPDRMVRLAEVEARVVERLNPRPKTTQASTSEASAAGMQEWDDIPY